MNLIGANYRTTLSNFVALIFTSATAIAAAPSELDVLPQSLYPYRLRIIAACGFIAFISRLLNGSFQKDKTVTGGSTMQTLSGNVAEPGSQTMVDATLLASKASGESLTPAQNQIATNLQAVQPQPESKP